jgi:hypothetical protein
MGHPSSRSTKWHSANVFWKAKVAQQLACLLMFFSLMQEFAFYPEVAPVTTAHIFKLVQLGLYTTNHVRRPLVTLWLLPRWVLMSMMV